MSLQSWRDEFYSVEAKDATGSALEAAEHSLRKWKGLRKAELEKHGLEKVSGSFVRDADAGFSFWVDDRSCALCCRDERLQARICSSCPLYAVRGEVACDSVRHEETRSPYRVFRLDGDPEPMISWLEKTVEYCKAQRPESDESYEASAALLNARAK